MAVRRKKYAAVTKKEFRARTGGRDGERDGAEAVGEADAKDAEEVERVPT